MARRGGSCSIGTYTGRGCQTAQAWDPMDTPTIQSRIHREKELVGGNITMGIEDRRWTATLPSFHVVSPCPACPKTPGRAGLVPTDARNR